MSNFLPLLTSTNRHISSHESSKRKCVALAQKAAPTCTLSLTSVSVSAHGSSDSFNPIPFPSSPATIPFPSTPVQITTPTSPTKCSPSTPCPRPRLRSHTSLLRRKRSTARLLQPCILPSSSQVESEPDQLSSTPPRKRARKASISNPSTSLTAKTTFHSLAVSSQRKGKPSKKAAADLRFLCTVYRSVAWLRLHRDFNEAARSLMRMPESMEIDTVPMRVSVLDAQESLLLSRLRSYLIYNEMSPQWLDVTPLHPTTLTQEVDMDMDIDIQESNPSPDSSPQPPTLPHLPIITQEQVAASLLFRYRHRSKGKSKPEAPAPSGEEDSVRMRRRSPLAGSEVFWVPEEP